MNLFRINARRRQVFSVDEEQYVMQRIVLNDGTAVMYEFEHKRVKNINMRIRKDGSVYVSAPRFVSQKTAEQFIISKSDFIIRALKSLSESKRKSCREHNPDEMTSDEIFTVLGETRSIDYVAGLINASPSDTVVFLRQYDKYRRMQLKKIVLEYCEQVYPYFKQRTKREFPEICFRQMKSRWGVCVPAKNRITFSYNLFECPPECIMYVVCHEFTHFFVPNHSEKFYFELSKTCPEYKELRKKINRFSF
ncbi:MAG: M48 family metallopeptidase [Clostridia bacterium]|nr:M48 family metallopeptidase [Clostridia bacterium]